MKKLVFLLFTLLLTCPFAIANCGYLGSDGGCNYFWCPAADPTQSCVVIDCGGPIEVYCAS